MVRARPFHPGRFADSNIEWVAQSTNGGYVHDFTLGAYLSGDYENGIRSHPYSSNRKVNPLTYADVKKSEEVCSTAQSDCRQQMD